jgi:hypothetical protein
MLNKLNGWAIVLACVAGAMPARAAIIYDTHDQNGVGELAPNADDGTPNRPAGDRMGNTIIFGGTARALDTVSLVCGTYHFNNTPDTTQQTWTMSLYAPDGANDPTGPGNNGKQPGTLIASSSVNTNLFNTGTILDTLTFNFGGVTVPNTVVAIASSSLIGNADLQVGVVPSSDHTPLVGSNPFGDRAWYGTAIGTFSSDTSWFFNDSGGDASVSNNLAMVFSAHDVPEPATLGGLGLAARTLLKRRRRRNG